MRDFLLQSSGPSFSFSSVEIGSLHPSPIWREKKVLMTRVMHSGADELEVKRRTYVPSMHRKHSSNRGGGRIHGRNSGAVYRQVQKIVQSE
jgi:hypothetical protein